MLKRLLAKVFHLGEQAFEACFKDGKKLPVYAILLGLGAALGAVPFKAIAVLGIFLVMFTICILMLDIVNNLLTLKEN